MTALAAILSGGMDSTTLAYEYAGCRPSHLILISFDYGQRHRKELEYAARTAQTLGADHRLISLRELGAHLKGSALTDPTVAVPHGHYADETMRATVVPNRNAIMLSIAIGICIAEGVERLGTGVHAGDHAIYPDCRPQFIDAMQHLALVANDGFISPAFVLDAPFLHVDKTEIARRGEAIGVPWAETWSCYEEGIIHCGACATCYERAEAFDLAGVADPTIYATVPASRTTTDV